MFFVKIFAALVFAIVIQLFGAGAVFAYQTPDFTSCVNPQGQVIASYETGTHGIAGNSASFEGKDVVFSVSENAVTQCFCAEDGKGIQTNWWKIADLSESEINILKSQGWNYVPNGALWGLDPQPYLALNSDYSCKASGGDSSNNNSSNSSDPGSAPNSSGNVLAAASGGVGEVLGLASTGNNSFLLGTFLTALISILLGLILKKRLKNYSK